MNSILLTVTLLTFGQVDLSSISGVELALNIAAIDDDTKTRIEPPRSRSQDDDATRRVQDLENRVKELEQKIVSMKDLISKLQCRCVNVSNVASNSNSSSLPTILNPLPIVESQRIIRQEPTVYYQYQSAPMYQMECSNGSCRLIRRR